MSKQLDSYSMLIVANYFKTIDDFKTVQMVCKKFKDTSAKFHYNPVPLDNSSRSLFPNLETLHVKKRNDIHFTDGRIFRQVIWYTVDYDEYLEHKKHGNICKRVEYTKQNRIEYGTHIPENVHILGEDCFGNCNQVEQVILPESLQTLKYGCFNGCKNLKSLDIPNSVTQIGTNCFVNCSSLTSISLPISVHKLDEHCFYGCDKLRKINSPDYNC